MTKKQYEMLIERIYCAWMNRKTSYQCSLLLMDGAIGVTVFENGSDGNSVLNLQSYEFHASDTITEVTERYPRMYAVLCGRYDPFYQ